MLALRDLPNVLTVGRLLLVAPLVYCLLSGAYTSALIIAVISGLSDWLDGALARRFNWQSQFGGTLDPLADKVLLIAVFGSLSWLGALPVWLFVLMVLRDLTIVTGAVCYHRLVEPFRAAPTRLSKFNTLCNVVLMWLVLTMLAGLRIPAALIDAMVGLVALTVVATLMQYVWVWGRRAWRHGGRGSGPESTGA